MLNYIKKNGGEINDPNIMIKLLNGTQNRMYLHYGSFSVRDNETVVLYALKIYGIAIMKASRQLHMKLIGTTRTSPNPPDECWVPT